MAGREAALKDYIEVNVRIMKFYDEYRKLQFRYNNCK